MLSRRTFAFLFLLLLQVAYSAASFAQCAMCRTSVESDLKNGNASIGTNLNTGIIYLMLIPYIALSLGAYFFFRKQINAKVKDWKNRKFPVKQS